MIALILAVVAGLVVLLARDGRRDVFSDASEAQRVPQDMERASPALQQPVQDTLEPVALDPRGSRAPIPSTVSITATGSVHSAERASAAVEGTEGRLAGRWADPQGEPIKGMRFQVVPVDPSLTPGYAQRAQGYFAHGLTSASPTTDLDGRFSIPGMCPGEYLATEGVETGWRVLGGPFATDREVHLVTASYRIELLILDAERRPLPPEVEAGLEEKHTFCSPRSSVGAGKLSRAPAGGSVAGRALSDGTVVFQVEPESTYLVGYSSRSIPTRFREVHVLRERCCTRLEIQLPIPTEPGELDLTILTPEGTPLDDLEWSQVYIHEAESGRAVSWGPENIRRRGAHEPLLPLRRAGRHTGPSFRCELAPGSYDVRVESQPYEGCARSSIEPRVAEFSPVERRIEILPGVRTDVAIALRGSGRLELMLALPPPDPKWLRREDDSLRWEEWFETVRAEAGAVHPRIVDARIGTELPVEFFVALTEEWPIHGQGLAASFTWIEHLSTPWILPGSPHRSSTPIPPGEYVVRVELPDGRELSGRVAIEQGRTTSLVLGP